MIIAAADGFFRHLDAGKWADIGPLAGVQVAEESVRSSNDHRRSSSTCTPAATNAACAAA